MLNQTADTSVAAVRYCHRDLRQSGAFGSERLAQSQHDRRGTSSVDVLNVPTLGFDQIYKLTHALPFHRLPPLLDKHFKYS